MRCARSATGAFGSRAPFEGQGAGVMGRSVCWFGAALIAAALASQADAQTTAPVTPTPHATARHNAHARRVGEPEGRQIMIQKNPGAPPSWLTLGPDASVGSQNNYVTSSFDQPSTVEGTFAGYRGRERLQYATPGLSLFKF